jgi:hypothetical protein
MTRFARRFRVLTATTSAFLALALALAAGAGAAALAPAWSIQTLAVPTNFVPGDDSGQSLYEVTIANSGAAATDGSPVTITDTLAAGLEVKDVELRLRENQSIQNKASTQCITEPVGATTAVRCTVPVELPDGSHPAILAPGEPIRMIVRVKVLPDASGLLLNQAAVEGGGAAPASTSVEHPASAEPVGSGFEDFDARLLDADGSTFTKAGGHPEQLNLNFALNTKATPPGTTAHYVPAGGDVKDLEIELPRGLIGNPTAVEECPIRRFRESIAVSAGLGLNSTDTECPDGSVVGFVNLQQLEGLGGILPLPLYNLAAPKGVAAQFGFQVLSAYFYVNAKVSGGSDYSVVTAMSNTSEAKRVTAFQATIWGNPADPSHDAIRGHCLMTLENLPFSFGSCPSGLPEAKPFLRLPTSCTTPVGTTMSFNTWNNFGSFASTTSTAPQATGCNSVPFDPTLEARPTTNVADSPTGLSARLHIPQEDEGPEGQAQADLRKAVVALPKGIAINPAGANGLAACSPAQIDLRGSGPSACPDASKIGSAEVRTPLLDHPLPGSVYVATPHDNPFDSLLAIYLVVDDPESGVVIKLPGQVAADPQSGQLTATFDENPQLPFEDFRLDFFGGAQAALRTPATCGSYATEYSLTPWSAPESGPPVTGSDPYAISQAPDGGVCPTSEAERPSAPRFAAGMVAPIARAYSPFVLQLKRDDGSKEFGSLRVSLPPGLLGKLAGVRYCQEAALLAAAARSGTEEKASPSCPSDSRIGTVDVGAGAGPAPFHVQGAAYLAGPYKGAPLSLAIVTPATAGPYDLGTVVVRSALQVDPESTRITAVSDPLPHILEGIPLDIRSIDLTLDRPSFTLNPTSCDPMSIGGELGLLSGGTAALSSRFQVGECGALRFKPKLALRLKGGTRRNSFPALTATLTMPPAGANIASASVALPHSEFLEQGHIRTICTRVQFAADACPAASVYGKAKAFSPLLDAPLRGPVYLRSSDNPLPDLVADLKGQIDVVLVGRIDTVRGGIRTSFEAVPDAPVSKFVLSMRGGKKGLLVNSRNICSRTNRAEASFEAQNGKARELRPVLRAKCPSGKKSGKRKGKR